MTREDMTNAEARERIDIIITKHEVGDEYVTITNEQDYEALRVAYKALESQKSGKWERHYTRPGVYADLWFHATCCGYKLSFPFPTEYCPNCGAKMERE